MSEICDVCSASYDYIYWVPDHVWEKIKPLGRGDGGLLCLQCVHHRSKEAGFVLRFSGSDKWWITDELTAARDENKTLREGMERVNANAEKHEREMYLAQDEAERLRGRVSELEHLIRYAQAGSGVCMCGDEIESHNQASGHSPVDIWDHAAEKALEGTSEAWLLRKQAEAVDEVEGLLCVADTAGDMARLSNDYAQRLRNQADELEGK